MVFSSTFQGKYCDTTKNISKQMLNAQIAQRYSSRNTYFKLGLYKQNKAH